MVDDLATLRVELATQGCELSASEIKDMHEDLRTLKRLIEGFPNSFLQITITGQDRHRSYHVKTSLTLGSQTLFTGQWEPSMHRAYERCIHKLIRKVQAYKARMAGENQWNKASSGNHSEVSPSDGFDALELDCAVAQDDYVSYRRAMDVFEDALSKRIGRWINRYPEIGEKLGQSITISDIVEEAFHIAYGEFLHRPHDVPPGKWLEGMIDPAVQALLQTPDQEYANISYSRAVLEMNS